MTEEELDFYVNYIIANKNIVSTLEERILQSKEALELKEAYNKGKEEVTFKEIEQYSNHKLNAKLLMGIYLLEDYGFRFIKFDFAQKLAKFKLFCN